MPKVRHVIKVTKETNVGLVLVRSVRWVGQIRWVRQVRLGETSYVYG